jgi:hypothetical protein
MKSAPNAVTLERRDRRARKEIELAAKIRALPDRRFGLILADPPWRFEPYSRETGLERDAANHYPVMTLEKIKKLEVPSIAAADCGIKIAHMTLHEKPGYDCVDRCVIADAPAMHTPDRSGLPVFTRPICRAAAGPVAAPRRGRAGRGLD